MRSFSRALLGLAIFVGVAPGWVAGASPPMTPDLHRFEADVGPLGPVVLRGGLATIAGGSIDGPLVVQISDFEAGDRLELSTAKSFALRVHEKRWTTLDHAGPRVEWAGRGRPGFEDVRVVEATGGIVSFEFSDASKLFLRSAHAPRSGFGLDGESRCEVRPRDTEASAGRDDPLPGDEILGSWVHARCRAESFGFQRASRVTVVDARVSSIVAPETAGALRLDVSAGTSTSRNETVEGAVDHVERVVTVDFDGPLRVRIGRPFEFAASAPELALAGELRLSARTGTIVWGTQRLEGEVHDLRPAGTFRVAAHDSTILVFDGATSNAPPSTAAGAKRGLLAEPTVWLAIAAAVSGAAVAIRAAPLLVGLFTRHTRDGVLDHATRQRIVHAVEANPGLNLQELAEEIGAGRNVVVHHVRVLRTHGLVELRRFGRRTAVFMSGAAEPTSAQHPALRNPTVRHALAILRREPRQTQESLAGRLGLQRSSVTKMLARLERWGLVRREGRRRDRRYVVLVEPEPNS